MRNYIIGGLALILAAAAPTTAEALITADCTVDPSALSSTLAGPLDPGEVIEVVGPCVGGGEIRTDDLTIQGVGVDPTVAGELFVNGARRVVIQNLKVQGDGTPGTNGIVATNGAAITVATAVVDGAGDHNVIVLHGASAILDQVTIQNGTIGVAADDNASVQVLNGSLIDAASFIGVFVGRGSSVVVDASTIQNCGIGIDFNVGAAGNVIGSMIQNNVSTGIHVFRGSSAVLEGNTIQGNPEGVSLNNQAIGWLSGNTISTSSTEDDALFIGWGSSARMNGGNTITSPVSAIFLRQGATLNQRSGDVVNGPVTIDLLSNAEFRNVSITGPVEIVDSSIVRFRDQSGSPAHISVTGNTSVSRDSGLNFLRNPGEQKVRVVGNINCADKESSLFGPSSNLLITGNKNCTDYNN